MKLHHHAPTTLAALLALQAISLGSQPVSVSNFGFENPVVADGNSQAGTPNWTAVGTSDRGVLNPSISDYATEAPEGSNVGYVSNTSGDAGISQSLAGVTGQLQVDASYALNVKVGNTAFFAGFPGYRVQLLANGTVLAEDDNSLSPGEGAFVTSTVNYSYNAGLHSALVGQALEIRLLAKGLDTTEVDFDDVQLSVTYGNPVAIAGGPYAVFAGGSLVLNGSPSLPSDGETISTYEWDLDNDGDYDEAITTATPAPISEATLTGTYGMSLGGNTIKLRVTDSATKTSVKEATVNILPATAVVYEPFNYSGTALSGASGSSEVGFAAASTWNASADSKLGPNRAFGPLVTRGAGIGDLQTGINRFGGARAVSASALAGNGLLSDGVTLWFSVIMGYDTGGNVTNSRLALALANNQFSASNFKYWIVDEAGPQYGSGLGVVMGANGPGTGKVTATRFRDLTLGTGAGTAGDAVAGNVFGTFSPVLYSAGQSGLIVGKITWGAVSDTIELYNPGADLVLPATPISTLTTAVNQSTFDTITWSRGDKVVMDEIRFGGSYQAVIETGSAWDLNGDTAGAGSATPSGTWNTDTIWNLASDGTLVPIPWQAGGVAAFSAGNDATGAYTITVNGTQDISGLVFEDGTVTVSGGTALQLTANTTASVATGLTATIATPFTENAAGRQLAKAGSGTLILSGNNVAATGGMNLSAGVVQFETPAAINGTARNVAIGSAGAMMFGPGFGDGNIPTALLDRVTTSSSGAIVTDNYAATNFDFNTPGLTAARLGAVGAVNYTGALTPQGTTYRLGGGGGTLTMANTNALTGANGVVINGNVTLAGNNDYTGTTTINASSTVTVMGSSTTSAVTLNTPNTTLILGNNASLGAGTLTVANSFAGPGTLAAIGTVVTTNPVTANTDFNFGGTGTLTIGTVTVGTARTITNNNTTNVSTIGSITSSAASSITFSGNGSTTLAGVIGGGSGITTISKGGTGVLSLNSANTYTGSTTVTGGVLLLNNATSIPGGIGSAGGTSALILNGGVVGLGTGDFSRPLNTTATVTAVNFTGNGGWAAYGADRLVNLGGASATVAWGTLNTGLNGKTLILGATTATHMVTVQNPLDLGAATRTVQVNDGAAAIDATLSKALSGTGALTKSGTGTLVLSDTNTYSGGTNATAGTLTINGSLADATMSISSGAVVNGTATLTFNINGLVADQVVVSGGTINLAGLTVAVNATGSGLTESEYILVNATSGTISGTFAGLTGAAGYTLNYITPNQVKLVAVPSNPYATWSGGPVADIDTNGDGVDNGIAWVVGAADPNANAIGLVPTLDNTTDPDFFIFNYRRSDTAAADTNTAIKVQYGSDLVSWTDATAGPDIIITPSDDFFAVGIDKVEVKIRRTLAVGGKLLTRLNVVVTP